MLRATVSGSFHRHLTAIYEAVGELRAAGVDVLSPADPRVVDHLGEFLFVASDRLRSIKIVQQRHFQAIRHSHFLWVVCPDGYTGESTSGEIGAAVAMGVPIFASHTPANLTWQQFMQVVPNIKYVVDALSSDRTQLCPADMLLDPASSADSILRATSENALILSGKNSMSASEAERRVRSNSRLIADAVSSLAK
jgi:hypothetical protein